MLDNIQIILWSITYLEIVCWGIKHRLRLIFMIPGVDGMLISVFVIDLIMALDYVVNADKISGHGKITIAITKLLGDLFAWLAYSKTAYINVIGMIVFLLNLYYLSICLELNARAFKKKKERR